MTKETQTQAESANSPSETEASTPPEAWAVAVLRVMSEAEAPLTLGEIKLAVGREVPVAGPAPLDEEIAILTKYDFLLRDDVSGHYSLSNQGVALLDGVKRDAKRH